MNYAVNSKQMKAIDDYTVKVLKIPALVLMERAALKVAEVVQKRVRKSDRILAVCGPGNNGGDGIAAGRILFLQGFHVAILFLGDESKATEQTKTQLEIARNLGITFENNNKLPEYNVIIDAIFGIGLSRLVTGELEEFIHEINHKKGPRIIFSVDIPSGISADNGGIMNAAVKADYTITFGLQKIGLLLYPGAEYAGDIIIADIGFPEVALKQAGLNTFFYEKEDLKYLPERKKDSHKGTYGKVLIIAGSKGMSGTAFLSAKAAYKTGAGLVKVLTSYENRVILQSILPEALYAAYDEEGLSPKNKEHEIMEAIDWASVIVIGPGLGRSDAAKELLSMVLPKAKVPVIIDADGLNLLSETMDPEYHDIGSRWNYLAKTLQEETILTPHVMEYSRLLGVPVSEISNNRIDTIDVNSYNSNLIVALKDARTIVTKPGSRYINISGNNGMATGGSGDVLTGIIAGLVAQDMPSFDAVCLAVYIHGLAGDIAASEKSFYSLMAGDIVDSIEKVIKRSNHQISEV